MYKFESWGGRKDSKPSLTSLVQESEVKEECLDHDVTLNSDNNFVSKTSSPSGGTVIFTANISPKKGSKRGQEWENKNYKTLNHSSFSHLQLPR
jgi:tRNA(Phe) wybutosine-synthesizing methylase Tyw3